MPKDAPSNLGRPKIDFDSPKAAPTVLAIGAALWRAVAWWGDVDFILSIREEKIAMTLQLLLDWGWLILVVVGILWMLGVHKFPKDPTRVHWGMVASVGILAFMAGALITVRSIGSTPVVLGAWGGDANAKTCSAMIDTSRLVGLKDKDRVILLCGVADATRDSIEDDRIAVSQPFTITGQTTTIVAPYGAMEVALASIPQNQGFGLWHSAAVIPKDVNVAEIKRVSDVAKRGGKVITEPQAGAWANGMLNSPTAPPAAVPGKP